MAKPTFPRKWGAKEINQAAREALADDNPPMLRWLAMELTDRQVSYRRGEKCKEHERAPTVPHLVEDMRQVGYIAGYEAADAWRGGEDFYKRVGAVIANAMQEHLRAGGRHDSNTWKGGYDSHTRHFGSQQHDDDADKELRAVVGGEPEAVTEEPAADETHDADELHDAEHQQVENERAEQQEHVSEAEEAGEVVIAAGADMAGEAAERTDGPHDDDERLNPRNDGETAYGVDGATRGANTGRLVPDAEWIARQMALAGESQSDQEWFDRVELSGGFEPWVNKDGNRKRARDAHEARHRSIRRRVRDGARQILETHGEYGLQAAWLSTQRTGLGRVTTGERAGKHTSTPKAPARPGGRGVEPAGRGVVSAAWPQRAPGRERMGKGHFAPETVWLDYWQTVTVGGHAWADQLRNVEAWRKARAGALLSLLDTVGAGVRVRTRERAAGWGEPLVSVTVRSLMDDADV